MIACHAIDSDSNSDLGVTTIFFFYSLSLMFLRTVLALDNVSDLDSSRNLVRQIEMDSLYGIILGVKCFLFSVPESLPS